MRITSWNEGHGGNKIKPPIEDGDWYLRRTAEHAARFKMQRTCSASNPAP